MERHACRLWFCQSESEPYSFNTVQFGDRPAAAIMSLAVERASETATEVATDLKLPADLVQRDADKLLRDTYVDDKTMGGSPSDISRLMGSKLPNGEFTGTIPSMACKVGLKIKSMVCSGSDDQEAINKLLGAVGLQMGAKTRSYGNHPEAQYIQAEKRQAPRT